MATAYPGGLRKRGGLLDNEDTIQATPRNPFFGGVADLLGQAYKLPEMPRMGVPGMDFMAANRNRLMDLLGVGDVQKTADTLSYGFPVGTGKGMTYKLKPETIGAAMALAPMVAPAARMAGEGVAATGRFVAPKAGQLAEQYMVSTGGILPLDVYHGTPHTLPPTPRNPLGEFDASKIGTGEGAQAYGHGIYVAENPAVAERYKLAGVDTVNLIGRDGNAINISALPQPLQKAIEANVGAPDLFGNAERFLANKTNQSFYSEKYGAQSIDDSVKALKNLNAAGVSIKDSGNLYKVDLPDAKIAKMLDWDKPLSQQPANVRKALAQYMDGSDTFISPAGGSLYNPSGKQIYESITGGVDAFSGKGSEISAKKLRELGIPGIKYLDEGSRSAGKGTRNFVVFPGEEKSMTILERNAQRAEELKRLQAGGLLAP